MSQVKTFFRRKLELLHQMEIRRSKVFVDCDLDSKNEYLQEVKRSLPIFDIIKFLSYTAAQEDKSRWLAFSNVWIAFSLRIFTASFIRNLETAFLNTVRFSQWLEPSVFIFLYSSSTKCWPLLDRKTFQNKLSSWVDQNHLSVNTL